MIKEIEIVEIGVEEGVDLSFEIKHVISQWTTLPIVEDADVV